MKPPIIVERDHVRFSVFYAVRKTLRRCLGKGDHEPLARKVADDVADHFDLCGWRVQGSPLGPHSTPSGPPQGTPDKER